MDKNFQVKVNKTKIFDLNRENTENLDVIEDHKGNYHILLNNQSFKAELQQYEFNKKEYTFSINSNIYKIEISDSLDILIDEMGFSNGSVKLINNIKAPMPGIILAVHVEVGNTVKKGDTLLILEAMKMENAIICQRNAKIKNLYIKEGDAIEKGKILIEFE